jgi:methionyl-tRNA formyltransferase
MKHELSKSCRIALLHFDSLNCLPALAYLFDALGGRIGLVVSSERFASPKSFWRQFTRMVSHSGLRITLALGFDSVALQIAAWFAPAMRRLGYVPPLRTAGEHARSVGATHFVASDVNSATTLAVLRQFKPDLVVSFHFDQILRDPFISTAACTVLNVHPALLPAHRGPCPSFWMLAAGDDRCGVTIHRIVDASIDAGDVLGRRQRPVPPGLSMAELDEILFEDGARALLSLLTPAPGTIEIDPPGNPPAYESFPEHSIVRAARARGVRLWRLTHAIRSIARLFGWWRG